MHPCLIKVGNYSEFTKILESSLKSFHDKADNKINTLNKECMELSKEWQKANKHIPKINQSIVLINLNTEKLFAIQFKYKNRKISESKIIHL